MKTRRGAKSWGAFASNFLPFYFAMCDKQSD
jgi:hypothetical protein